MTNRWDRRLTLQEEAGSNKNGSGVSRSGAAAVIVPKIIGALAVAFLSVLSSSHLLAAAAPAHARLSQVRRRVAAPAAVAPAAAAVAAVAADHKHPALSLFDRVLDLQVRHREAA